MWFFNVIFPFQNWVEGEQHWGGILVERMREPARLPLSTGHKSHKEQIRTHLRKSKLSLEMKAEHPHSLLTVLQEHPQVRELKGRESCFSQSIALMEKSIKNSVKPTLRCKIKIFPRVPLKLPVYI